MKKKYLFLFLIFISFLGFSCNKDNNAEVSRTFYLTIASERENKSNIEESPSYGYIYYVKYPNSDQWTSFPYEILNFDYEEGYEYVIHVKEIYHENVPQDAPSFEYFLIELVSKEKKDSNVFVD